MNKLPDWIILYKYLFALLAISAISTEIIVLVNQERFVFTNFFSYFTILSNAFAAVVLIVSARISSRQIKSGLIDMLRGAATLYMVVTGIVFSTLLAGLDARLLTAVPWDNYVLHYIMPIVVLLDWAIHPPEMKILFKHALAWLAFPLTYVAYTLIRGPFVNWYPYPFLDPANGGYGQILVISLSIAALTSVLVWAIVRVGVRNRRVSSRFHKP